MSSRAFSHSVFVSIILLFISLGTGVLAARLLGPENRGYLGVIIFWPQLFVNLANFPFSESMVVHAQNNKKEITRQYIKGLLQYALKVARLMMLIVIPIMLVATWINLRESSTEIILLASFVGVVYALTTFYIQVYIGVLGVTRKFSSINLTRLVMPSSYLFFILFFYYYLNFGLSAFVFAYTASLISQFVYRYFTQPDLGEEITCLENKIAFMKTTLSFHALTWVGIFASQIDRVLVLPMSSLENSGQYFVALSMTGPLFALVGPAIQSIGLPALSALSSRNRGEAAARLLRLTNMVSLIVSLGVAILAPFAAPFLFGEEFAAAGYLTSALVMAGYLSVVRKAFVQILKVDNYWKQVIINDLIFIGIFIFVYFLALYWGIVWPVVPAFAIGNVFSVMLYSYYLKKIHPHINSFIWIVPKLGTIYEIINIGLLSIKKR